MHLPPTSQRHRPPLLPSAPRVQEQVGLVLSFRQRAPRAEPKSPPPRILGPAVRPHLQRALPATLRRGPGPDTAALGLGEDRTNDRLPADPRSGFAHLGPEPITRGRSLSFSSQSDAEAKQAAGKPTPPKEGEGVRQHCSAGPPSFPGPSPSPPLARSAFLPPTPTSRARAIPGQETPWRRVGPNSSPAASRECRAPQPGPRPGTRSSQLLADNLGGLHIQRSIKRIPHVHNMLVEALQLTPTLRVASLQ
ncbi:hypothetical protein R6Z07F_016116 [Ovis aries]